MNIPPISITSCHEAGLRLTNDPQKYQFVISIGAPEDQRPDGFDTFHGQKLRLEFDDVSSSSPFFVKIGYIPPTRNDVKRLIDFCHIIDGPTLIHCAQGISRSSASALALIATKMGKGYEKATIRHLLSLKDKDPNIDPNELIVHYTDSILELQGELISAYKDQFDFYYD